MTHRPSDTDISRWRFAVLAPWALTLCACNGADTGGPVSAVNQAAGPGNVQTLALTLPVSNATTNGASDAAPLFHTAAIDLEEPGEADSQNPSASANLAPHLQPVPARLALLSTRRLTRHTIDAMLRDGRAPTESTASAEDATPMATGTVIATYTPAQIRAAYGLPSLPSLDVSLSQAQMAKFGAGQTIYIVDAQHDPNVAVELSTFNQRFGLPSCTKVAIDPGASLPVAPASGSGCTVSVVYSTSAGKMTTTVPTYDSGWATEIALDVQWAHATAPLARIVLIEATDASFNSLQGAVSLANAMGPGVVSMSFGSQEGNWTASVDSLFTTPRMTYLAATGDSGTGVEWPSVSAHVLAVGGSTLTYSGTGLRSETVWSGTGGGVSHYTPAPSYQSSAVPGVLALGKRLVGDVAFNADPTTGQYVSVLSPGSTTPVWISVGGTSLATPQWAGIIAVANALRALTSQAPMGAAHELLYGIASQAATYRNDFYDITRGTDGSCATCFATIGYDLPSGVGTPNVSPLLTSLAGGLASQAPVVTSTTIKGTAGTPLSFAVTATAAAPVSYTLTNAPSGLTISSSGVITWGTPVLGTYAVTVTARDTVSALTGQGLLTISIVSPQPPVVAPTSITGTAGTGLAFTIAVTDSNPFTIALNGAQPGMAISAAGLFSWPNPTVGKYTVTVLAKDTKTGLSGSGVLTVNISPAQPPTVVRTSAIGIAGQKLSFTVVVSAAGPVALSLSNAPTGMSVNNSGVVSWASPVAGSYSVTIVATDINTHLSGSAAATITIAPAGPVIHASSITGVVGKALTGSISFTDSTSNVLTITIGSIPAGMSLIPSGAAIGLQWASPVAGSYSLTVKLKDGNGQSAAATMPIIIAAK